MPWCSLHTTLIMLLCGYLLLTFSLLPNQPPQNKILHSRVEALHIKLAEKDCHSAGISSGSTSLDPLHDAGAGLQNVVNYLRRSKEIVCVSHLQGFSFFIYSVLTCVTF